MHESIFDTFHDLTIYNTQASTHDLKLRIVDFCKTLSGISFESRTKPQRKNPTLTKPHRTKLHTDKTTH